MPPGDALADLAGTGRYVDPQYEADRAEADVLRVRLKASKRKAKGK